MDIIVNRASVKAVMKRTWVRVDVSWYEGMEYVSVTFRAKPECGGHITCRDGESWNAFRRIPAHVGIRSQVIKSVYENYKKPDEKILSMRQVLRGAEEDLREHEQMHREAGACS